MELKRTQGDGMEYALTSSLHSDQKQIGSNLKIRVRPGDKVIYRPSEQCRTHIRQVVPKSPIIKIVPKLLPKDTKKKTFIHSKEPKFVPYEPFKAAVTPLVYSKTNVKKNKGSKNNIDIQILVSQMTSLVTAELKNNPNIDLTKKTEKKLSVTDQDYYQKEIRTLKDSNEQLEQKLKFQTQVNSELKTLLVAAVGEDLEARVQLLTEDKLQLARALLNSAQHLSTHREQVEWLAGHCEVWRSKFLASSLMVSELARWKTVLTKHINELQDSVKHLLEEHNYLNVTTLNIWQSLLQIANKFDIKQESTEPLNTIARLNACQVLSEKLFQKVVGSESTIGNICLKELNIHTPAEVTAQNVLAKSGNVLEQPSNLYNILSPSAVPSYCSHCNSQLVQL